MKAEDIKSFDPSAFLVVVPFARYDFEGISARRITLFDFSLDDGINAGQQLPFGDEVGLACGGQNVTVG